MYHCPVNFRVINKPIVFSAVYLDGDWSKINRNLDADGREFFTYDGAGIRRCVRDSSKECIYCGSCFSERMNKKEEAEAKGEAVKDDTPDTNLLAPFYEMAEKTKDQRKYAKFVYPYQPEEHSDDRFLSPRAGFRGVSEMEGSRLWYLYNIVQKECVIGETHMHHAVEEYIFFTGADITHFFDFDAEIEIQIGESPDDMDTYTITEPTVVRVPAGMRHGPVNIKRLGAPINFEPFYPSGNYGRVVYKDGQYIFEGTDLPKK